MSERETNITLSPEKIIQNGKYEWFIYSKELTGMAIVGIRDSDTGISASTALANKEIRSSAHRAWGGARQSRAPGTPAEIYHEMGLKGIDPDQKLEEMFAGYGHASVGDMARMMVDLDGIPRHVCQAIFLEGAINSGQEKSTRYQKQFGSVVLHPSHNYTGFSPESEISQTIDREYQALGQLSLQLFEKHKTNLEEAFTQFYRPEKGQMSALKSRVLDSARFFLLYGQSTGMSYETSARDWARLISKLRAAPLDIYKRLGDQLTFLLSPPKEIESELGFKAEAPSLIKHTEANNTHNNNLVELARHLKTVGINGGDKYQPNLRDQEVTLLESGYSEMERAIAQCIQTIYPGISVIAAVAYLRVISDEQRREISEIIFANHNHWDEMPQSLATSRMTFVLNAALGEVRDFARHRAFGRHSSLPSLHGGAIDEQKINEVLSYGYGLPLYLSEEGPFTSERGEFISDMNLYYSKVADFIDSYKNSGNQDYSVIMNLLPMAHFVQFCMHGDPKQVFYMTHQRVRPGGHINYRDLAWQMNQLLANSDPFYDAVRFEERPDPFNRDEFFDRS